MLNAAITKRFEVTPDLIIFQIKPDTEVPDFSPGQYVALGLPGSAARPSNFPPEAQLPAPDKIIKRAYSIGSPPQQKEYLEFYIAIAPLGALTSRLAMLHEGDRLFMNPKITGTFTLHEVPADHNLILVSTGTGIAPYMSMLRTESSWTPQRRITLLHGARHAQDLAYREELLALAAREPRFTYHAIVSREDPAWHGPRGYVQSFFNDGTIVLDPRVDHVFMCGNPGMIDQTQKYLEAHGYTVHSKRVPGNLHLEKYW
ncbi:MAG: ferredoxin--NADP reductase [Oligoflexia bacterium]|nr:ferredoxin--NADP reductase [Oligoflexia bacterium]